MDTHEWDMIPAVKMFIEGESEGGGGTEIQMWRRDKGRRCYTQNKIFLKLEEKPSRAVYS